MKIAMCTWPGRGGKSHTFDGPVIKEFDDGSILVQVRAKGPRWIEGTRLRVEAKHVRGYAEQTVVSPADLRAPPKGDD